MGVRLNLTGKKFNKLTVIQFFGKDNGNNSLWKCKCDCGKDIVTRGSSLKSYKTKSCGCDNKRSIKHGQHGSLEYHSWQCMKSRCLNKNDPRYEHYGKRGIKVYDQWINSFETFLKDMGKRPSKSYTLNRIDNNQNYNPTNCEWATAAQQARNRQSSKLTNSQVIRLQFIEDNIVVEKVYWAKIALALRVSKSMIYQVRKRIRWKNI